MGAGPKQAVARRSVVLLVDDDPLVRSALARWLIFKGHQPIAAAGPNEARRLSEEHRPNALIVDLHLDGGDGLRLLRELQSAIGGPPRTVLMTGDGDDVEVPHDVQVLVKPFTLDELEASLTTERP